jgi:hypothetical protein
MAARAMSFDSDSTPERWHLGRKLTLLFLLVIALGLGLVILFHQRTTLPLLVFNLFADISIGLVVGLATRFVLRQRNWFVRGLASAALAVIGLLVSGYCTDGKIGMMLPPVGLVRVDWLSQWHIPLELPLQVMNTQMNWAALVYMVIAIDTSWIALRAWNQTAPRTTKSTSLPARRVRRSARSSSTHTLPHLSLPKIQLRNSNAKPKVRRKRSERPRVSMSVASGSVKATRSKQWNPLHRKPQIQLAVHEDHRCPYCLEEVKPNDPRGVVECEVCHTLHHKDCWAITGACQVPHLNT